MIIFIDICVFLIEKMSVFKHTETIGLVKKFLTKRQTSRVNHLNVLWIKNAIFSESCF